MFWENQRMFLCKHYFHTILLNMCCRNNKLNIQYTVLIILWRVPSLIHLALMQCARSARFIDWEVCIVVLFHAKIPPFPLLPPSTLLHSLHCLDPIQMFFFSTPLWREPTPIVHKISPMVPANPAQFTKHAHTVCKSFMSRQSCILSLGQTWSETSTQEGNVSQHSNNCNTVWIIPLQNHKT